MAPCDRCQKLKIDCLARPGRSCRACIDAKRKCFRDGGIPVARGRPKGWEVKAKAQHNLKEEVRRPKRKRAMKDIVESDDEVEEVAGPSMKKTVGSAVRQLMVGKSVKLVVPELEDDPEDDELGAAVRDAGKAMQAIGQSIFVFGEAFERLGGVIGKYDLRKD